MDVYFVAALDLFKKTYSSIMIQRRFVRETVLQAVYAYLQSGESISHIIDTLLAKNLKEDGEAIALGSVYLC